MLKRLDGISRSPFIVCMHSQNRLINVILMKAIFIAVVGTQSLSRNPRLTSG